MEEVWTLIFLNEGVNKKKKKKIPSTFFLFSIHLSHLLHLQISKNRKGPFPKKLSHLIFAIYDWYLMQKSIYSVPHQCQAVFLTLSDSQKEKEKKNSLFAKAITGVPTSNFHKYQIYNLSKSTEP